MNPLISIIVPVYKVERYLDECVRSIAGQTYGNIEIILVDDGSPDSCGRKCDEWAAADSRVRVIHQENTGLSGARNTGIDAASGEYIAFVDSDDILVPGMCESVISAFRKNRCDIVCFDVQRVNDKGEVIGVIENPNKNTLLDRHTALCELSAGRIKDYYWNKVYRAELFCGVRCPVGHLMEDMYTTYKLFLNSESIYCLSESLYRYRHRDDSILQRINATLVSDTFMAAYTRYRELSDIYPDAASNAFMHVALSALGVHDHSLWEDVNADILESSHAFLNDNKQKILAAGASKIMRMFFGCRSVYNIYRTLRHRAADTCKCIRSLGRRKR